MGAQGPLIDLVAGEAEFFAVPSPRVNARSSAGISPMPGCIGATAMSATPVCRKFGPANGDADGVFSPPAMMHLPIPDRIDATACWIAIMPDAHHPPIANPGVSGGSPSSRAEYRAMQPPPWRTSPSMMLSIEAVSTPERSITPEITVLARSNSEALDNPPTNERAKGVRA